VKIELFYSPGCTKCLEQQVPLQATARQIDPALAWRELNVLEELDYAVSLGILTLPAVAIDGELVFTSLPTAEELTDAVRKRLPQRT